MQLNSPMGGQEAGQIAEYINVLMCMIAALVLVMLVTAALVSAGLSSRGSQIMAALPNKGRRDPWSTTGQQSTGAEPDSEPATAFGAKVGSDTWWLRSFIMCLFVECEDEDSHGYVHIDEVWDRYNACCRFRGSADFVMEAGLLARAGLLDDLGAGVYRVSDKGWEAHEDEMEIMERVVDVGLPQLPVHTAADFGW